MIRKRWQRLLLALGLMPGLMVESSCVLVSNHDYNYEIQWPGYVDVYVGEHISSEFAKFAKQQGFVASRIAPTMLNVTLNDYGADEWEYIWRHMEEDATDHLEIMHRALPLIHCFWFNWFIFGSANIDVGHRQTWDQRCH